MGKASDNPFPSILVVEGAAPATPAGGDQRLFVDVADHLLKLKASGGGVTPVGGAVADITDLPAAEMDTSKRLAPDGAGGVAWGTGGGGSGLEITDGVHDVTGATSLTVTGGTVGGTTPDATLTVTGGSGGLPDPGSTTPTLVQFKNSGDLNTSAYTVTLDAAPSPGDILVAVVSCNASRSITLSQTNVAWVRLEDGAGDPDDHTNVSIWIGYVAGSAGAALNVNLGTYGTWTATVVYEFTGPVGVPGASGTSRGFTGAPMVTPKLLPDRAISVIIVGIRENDGSNNFSGTIGGGFTSTGAAPYVFGYLIDDGSVVQGSFTGGSGGASIGIAWAIIY